MGTHQRPTYPVLVELLGHGLRADIRPGFVAEMTNRTGTTEHGD